MLDYLNYSLNYLLFWLGFYPTARFCVFLTKNRTHPNPRIAAAVDLVDRVSKDATVVGYEMALELHEAEMQRVRESLQ